MPDVNFDADTESDADTPTDEAPAGGSDEPDGPTAAGFDPTDADTIAEGAFDDGATAADTDPLTAMLSGPPSDNGESTGADTEAEGPSPSGNEDAEEAEPEAEDDGAEAPDEPDDEREAQREQWLDTETFSEKTGIQADDPDEAAEQVNRLKDQLAGTQELQNIIQERPGFQQMLQHMAEGKTVAEAAAALDGVEVKAPDPQESPEQYAEWKAAQKQKKQQREQELEEQKERQQQVQRQKQRLEQEVRTVADEHDLEFDEVARLIAQVTPVAPDVPVRPEQIHNLVRAQSLDERLEQAREEAYKKGREEALQEVRGDGTPEAEDGLPDLHSTGGGPSENEEQHEADVDDDVASVFGPRGASIGFDHDQV